MSLPGLRNALGFTLDEVCDRIAESGVRLTRGGLSAIEHGHRGASAQVLAALEAAYGLRAGDMATDYEPQANTRRTS